MLSSLNMLRTFTAAARLLSFKAAAARLNLSPTAVSHQIRKLETELGTALFRRGVRSVALTPAGERLLAASGPALDGIAAALAEIRNGEAPRQLTITATMAMSAHLIAPLAGAFARAFPGTALRILSTDDLVDLKDGAGGAGTADLALRHARAATAGGAVLRPGAFAPVAAPGQGDGDVAPVLTFAWRNPDGAPPQWAEWHARAAARPGGLVSFSDEAHAIAAALRGQGVLHANLAIIAGELREGRLRILAPPVPSGRFLVLERGTGGPDAWFDWWRDRLTEASDWEGVAVSAPGDVSRDSPPPLPG